jgi:AAA ATPase domain
MRRYDLRPMDGNELPVQSSEHAFVGRERELAQGLDILDDTLRGLGRLLLVGGEPGIGKSRLADELATRAREQGVQVVWGRCWEAGGAPAYWPWVQSLRSLTRHLNADQLSAQIGPGAVDISQLLPEVRSILGDVGSVPEVDPDAARFRLFDSATTLLRNAADARPLMLVLDDLQVADTPSLLLLRFVAGALGDARVLVLGTYRDTELRPDHPLSTAITELAREQTVRLVTLRGLAEADVGRLISAVAGITPHESLVRAAHHKTDGNPLFVGQVTSLLLEEGRVTEVVSEAEPRLGMPRSVREVIGKRLEHLPDGCVELLRLASVLGREFNLEALSQLSERPVEDVVAALDEALAARALIDVPGTRSRLRFSHVAIRECLYDDLGRTRQIQLHRRAARVLETLYGEQAEWHLAELAHHAFEGSPGGDAESAIRYARSAGDKAVSLLAYEEAVRLYGMALQGLDLSPAKDPKEQCEVLLALGDAQTRAADEAGSKDTFLRAASLGRSLKLGELVARAALGYGGRFVWGRAGGDTHLIPLLEEALAALGDGDSQLRSRTLARLAGALRDDRSTEPRESIGKQAVDVARQLGDPATLAYALEGLYAALWRPDNPEERLMIASETLALGVRAGDRERSLAAHQHRLFVFLELGDMPSVYRELDAIDRVAEELSQPAQSWPPIGMRAILTLFEGRFAEAEIAVSAVFRLRARTTLSDALLANALQLFHLRRAQGRLAEVADLVHQAAQQLTWYPVLRCAVALISCELGMEIAARTEFEGIAAGDFAGVPFDNKWVVSMSLLSETASLLGDHDRATILYEQLLPYAERNGVSAGDGCTGSVSRYLGMLAATMSRFDAAARHFEEGLQSNVHMAARPWAAHTQHDFAVMLGTRDGRGDRARAIELLRAALRTCAELGMPALQLKVTSALADLGAAVSTVQGEREDAWPLLQHERSVPLAGEDGSFRQEGEYWTLAYAGRLSRLRDSKGLRVLARLLATPGRPHAALDLERLGAPADEMTARAVASGDAGDLIDDQARRSYRARLAVLRQVIDEEGGLGHADRVGAMQEEMDFITRELSRALGLGGRSRRAGSIAERARLNVTRAVKSAMRRIAATDAQLAAHLEATVHTGTVCVYSPDPRSPVEWHISLGDVHQG